jgi:hypothetical protein
LISLHESVKSVVDTWKVRVSISRILLCLIDEVPSLFDGEGEIRVGLSSSCVTFVRPCQGRSSELYFSCWWDDKEKKAFESGGAPAFLSQGDPAHFDTFSIRSKADFEQALSFPPDIADLSAYLVYTWEKDRSDAPFPLRDVFSVSKTVVFVYATSNPSSLLLAKVISESDEKKPFLLVSLLALHSLRSCNVVNPGTRS